VKIDILNFTSFKQWQKIRNLVNSTTTEQCSGARGKKENTHTPCWRRSRIMQTVRWQKLHFLSVSYQGIQHHL